MKMYPRRLLINQLLPNLKTVLNRESYSVVQKYRFFHQYTIYSSIPAASSVCNSHQIRSYAKGKDKLKSRDKKVEIREDIIAEHINVKKMKEEMQQIIDKMKEQYILNVSLRSSLGAIETLKIEFEGEEYTIGDLAQINRKNPKVLALNLSAFPQTIPTVIDTLNNSGMNLNPQQDGNAVFIPIPKVTREHRENLAKNANTIFLKSKQGIVDIQRKYMRKLEDKQQNHGLSMELFLTIRDQITALVNVYAEEAKKMKDDKTKELTGE